MRQRRSKHTEATRAIVGYTRVSCFSQATKGVSLDARRPESWRTAPQWASTVFRS